MSVGSVLAIVSLILILAAYLARPFRRAAIDVDRLIESWVAGVRAEAKANGLSCPQCGRRVAPDDRFCAGCGMPVGGTAE